MSGALKLVFLAAAFMLTCAAHVEGPSAADRAKKQVTEPPVVPPAGVNNPYYNPLYNRDPRYYSGAGYDPTYSAGYDARYYRDPGYFDAYNAYPGYNRYTAGKYPPTASYEPTYPGYRPGYPYNPISGYPGAFPAAAAKKL